MRHCSIFFNKPYLLLTVITVAWLGLLPSCKQAAVRSTQNEAAYNTIIDSANHLYDAGRQSEALAYLDSVTTDLNSLTLSQKVVYYTLHYNYNYQITQNNSKAVYYANQLLKLSKTITNPEDHASVYSTALFYKGDALFRQNKYNEAYFNYYQGKIASSQSKKIQNCVLSDYSYHMGMILYKQEHYRMAAGYFKTSFKEAADCQETFRGFYRKQELLSNAGISYSEINELDSALLYLKKALKFINTPPTKYKVADSLLNAARGVVYGNEASVYIKKRQYNEAKDLLKKSIAINVKKGFENNDALISELKLVELYEQQNQIDSMLPVLRQTQMQLKVIKDDNAATNWNRLMASYYEHKNQLAQSIIYLKKYDTLKTKLNDKVLAFKANDITAQLKRFEKDHEVNLLKKNNEQKNLYLTIALVFFVMAVVILLLIYSNWLKSKRLLITQSELNHQVNRKNTDLEKALGKLEMSSQEKDRILHTVAHDLRNPIGGIASLTGSILDDDDCSAEQKNYLNLVKDTAYNTLELINEILEAANCSEENLNKQWVEINALLSNSVDLLRFKAAEKDQKIILNVLDTPLKLMISREKIWRVVSNLISNAIKFSQVGGLIEVSILKVDNAIKISVKDNGIGIPDTMQDKVFNMFTEAKRPGTSGEKSFGLGLSISRHIIELHGGKIWFENNQDSGTTFNIKLINDRQQKA